MTIGCAGSSPAPGTFKKSVQYIIARIAQLVEHDLAKVGVASPSLVSRSFQKSTSDNWGAFFDFMLNCFQLKYFTNNKME